MHHPFVTVDETTFEIEVEAAVRAMLDRLEDDVMIFTQAAAEALLEEDRASNAHDAATARRIARGLRSDEFELVEADLPYLRDATATGHNSALKRAIRAQDWSAVEGIAQVMIALDPDEEVFAA